MESLLGYEEVKITEDKVNQMTAEHRLRFKERFNTAELRRPILNSVSSETMLQCPLFLLDLKIMV